MGAGALLDPTFCIFVLTQHVCSPIVPKFLKADCPSFRVIFEQDSIISVVMVREILISDVYLHITRAAAENPVDGTSEESRIQYAPLTDTGCCEETVR